jgi:hypothetical protein
MRKKTKIDSIIEGMRLYREMYRPRKWLHGGSWLDITWHY